MFHTPAHKQTSPACTPAQIAVSDRECSVARFERQSKEWWARERAYAHIDIERDLRAERRAEEQDCLRSCYDPD